MSTKPATFAQRFAVLRKQRGPFCLGLDPTPELLLAWGLKDDIWGLRTFCNRVVDAGAQQISVWKPQSAFFERFGAAGLEVLADIIGSIHAMGGLALLDVKRGDIGSTNEAYASALLGPDSAMGADAVTLHAYLGFAALEPFLQRAQRTGCGLFVVVRSSNPEGEALQHAQIAPGVSVAQRLCDEIRAHNDKALADPDVAPVLRGGAPGIGPVGAVIGLTCDDAGEHLTRLSNALVLAPGLGAQGGTFEQLGQRFAGAKERVLASASRAVLARGPDERALRKAITEHCSSAMEALS